VGIGSTPEGIIATCSMKGLGGAIHSLIHPKDEKEKKLAIQSRLELYRV
jgi:fructose-1,6-bisphosphatase/sedoheptulose 1,7-bisphosphatase-like protein